MEINIKENTKMIRKIIEEYFIGLVVKNMKENRKIIREM